MTIASLRRSLELHASRPLTTYRRRRLKLFRGKSALWLDEFYFRILDDLAVVDFLECGAHESSASVKFVSDIGSRAVAVEANPETFEKKTCSAKNLGVTVLNFGVGRENGTMSFHIPKGSPMAGHASFRKPKYRGEDYRTIEVPVKTVDDVVNDELSGAGKLALWIDVEGLGLDVLHGAESTLKDQRCMAIKIEVETFEMFTGQALYMEVDRYLGDCGYSAVLCDFEFPQQFNVVYVKTSHIDAIDQTLLAAYGSLSRLTVSGKEILDYRLRKLIYGHRNRSR